jgi:hypothetical protein
VKSSCERGNEPSGSIKFWELPSGCTTGGLSSGTQLHRVSEMNGRSVLCRYWTPMNTIKHFHTSTVAEILLGTKLLCFLSPQANYLDQAAVACRPS